MPNDTPEKPRLLHDLLAHRSTVDLMILAFTFVVGFSILATGATIAIIEITNPSADTTTVVESLLTIITGIVGALLGLIAGKGESSKPPAAPPP